MRVGLNLKSYLDGPYAPVSDEATYVDLPVLGELPRDLHGMFAQNSPNPKYAPPNRYHWFDGDGMVHAVYIENGRATYRNRWVRTRDLAHEMRQGECHWPGLMNPIPDTLRTHPDKDTANTDLEWANGRLLALWWLGGQPYELSVPSLETKGVAPYDAKLPCGIASHPKTDRETGEMMFFDYSPYSAPYLHYGVISADGQVLAVDAITTPGPRLFHDIAITKNYTVLMDLPLLWKDNSLQEGRRRIDFDDRLPSRFGILPRHGGNDSIRWFQAPPCYIYHSVNAWEDGDEIVMIACRISNPLPRSHHSAEPHIPRLYFLRLAPTLHEWRFNLKTGETREKQLDDVYTEFPRINDNVLGRQNRYAYCPKIAKEPTLLFDGFIKYDLQQGRSDTFELGPGRFSSELCYVSSPDAMQEDEGWLISMVFNASENRSELQVLEAASPSAPIAIIPIPRRVPVGFHACWVPGDQMQS